MYSPIRFNQYNIPIFSSEQVNMYGPPDLYGWERFEVEISREEECPLVTDFEIETFTYKRPIHRYIRQERFVNTLLQLIGMKGHVPDVIIEACEHIVLDRHCIWNDIRDVLKENHWSKYYNRIPYIAKRIGFQNGMIGLTTNQKYLEIVTDFKKLNYIFESKGKRTKWKRRYFPNLRFICFKLLELHGVEFNFDIPIIRTRRKYKVLTELWEDLLSNNKGT